MEPIEIIGDEIKIDWNKLKIMAKDIREDVNTEVFYCKKCGESFYNRNYRGNYPLCRKHILKEVK
jgi:rubrerythrin